MFFWTFEISSLISLPHSLDMRPAMAGITGLDARELGHARVDALQNQKKLLNRRATPIRPPASAAGAQRQACR
jgi:hypothetical protein